MILTLRPLAAAIQLALHGRYRHGCPQALPSYRWEP